MARLWAGPFISTGHRILETTLGGEINIPCSGAALPNSRAPSHNPCWENRPGRMFLYAWPPLIGLGRHLAHRGPTYRLATYDMGGPRGSLLEFLQILMPSHSMPILTINLLFSRWHQGYPVLATKMLTCLHIQMREHRLSEVSEESHTSRKWRS